MANFQISSVGQPFVKTIIANQSGYVQGIDTSFAGARTASASSRTVGGMNIGLFYGAPLYRLQRGFLQFEVPENLSRIDGSVVASIYVSGFVGVSSLKVVATSVNYTNFSNPWNTWTTSQVWSAVQISASALYMSGSPYNVTATGWNNITLNNMLIKAHLLTKKYITIAWLEYDNDYLNSSPGASSRYLSAQGPSDANVPFITVNKPWFIDKRGNEYPVGEDFVIRASEVGVNQKNRDVQQLPFATAIPGPAFMRQRNSIYQVTKG